MFPNLILFATIFYLWVALLFGLIISSNTSSDWERLSLVAIFSLIFTGFWAATSSATLPSDGLVVAGGMKYIQINDRIPLPVPGGAYFEFPSLNMIGISLANLTGTAVYTIIAILVVFYSLLVSALLYLLFKRLIPNSPIAAMAAILLIQGSIVWERSYIYHATYWGFLLLIMLFLLIFIQGSRLFQTTRGTITLIMITLGTIVTHFVTSMAVLSIMSCVFILQLRARKRIVTLTAILLCGVTILTWQLYWSSRILSDAVNAAIILLVDFNLADILRYLFVVSSTKVGGEIPIWAQITRYLWLAILIVPGGMIGLWNLVRIRKLKETDLIITGALVGVSSLVILLTVASAGGSEFYRILLYAPLLTIPLLLRFILKNTSLTKTYGIAVLVLIMFVFSFPAFLSSHSTVSLSAWYSYETSAGVFLESTNGSESDVKIYSSAGTYYIARHYLPNAYIKREIGVEGQKGKTEVWNQFDKLLTDFDNERSSINQNALFMFTKKRLTSIYQHFYGISPSDPRWNTFEQRLAENHQIYDNGYTQLFRSSR